MNYFSHNPLHRFSELRPDLAHVDRLWQHKQKQVLLLSDLQCLFSDNGTKLALTATSPEVTEKLEKLAQVKVYLGSEEGIPYFVLGFEGENEELLALLGSGYTCHNLKAVTLQVPQKQSAILAYARGVVHWNLRHRYCPECGHTTQSIDAGHVRQCTSEDCQKLHFPRTDTAVIVLIAEGDACLLGRQAVWATGQFATLAGFLEPGETLEQAVAREAMEETGVQLQDIRYHSSQPWPFPSSIMVGFMASAVTRELQVNYDELEDARWFTRAEIINGLEAGTFKLPSKISISYRLIEEWFNAHPAYNLEEVVHLKV